MIINLHVTAATKRRQKIAVEDNAVLPLYTFLHTFPFKNIYFICWFSTESVSCSIL